jgi:hypothetical protein
MESPRFGAASDEIQVPGGRRQAVLDEILRSTAEDDCLHASSAANRSG